MGYSNWPKPPSPFRTVSRLAGNTAPETCSDRRAGRKPQRQRRFRDFRLARYTRWLSGRGERRDHWLTSGDVGKIPSGRSDPAGLLHQGVWTAHGPLFAMPAPRRGRANSSFASSPAWASQPPCAVNHARVVSSVSQDLPEVIDSTCLAQFVEKSPQVKQRVFCGLETLAK